MKNIRKIVHIDEDKCNGCGLCVPACHEGAIQVIDGKARLLEDFLCDGLGDCLGECPEDAIRIEEREADPFDEEAVQEHLARQKKVDYIAAPKTATGADCAVAAPLPCGCPGSSVVDRRSDGHSPQPTQEAVSCPSELRQWPVQAALVPPHAPFLQGEKLLVTADCVPFAMGDFHARILQGKPVLVGCPKLDDAGRYVDKFTAILKHNDIKEVTVAFMEVPCCGALTRILKQAVADAGKDVALKGIQVSTRGEIIKEGAL
jgi:NAD-dependent dihydropyrimidine dehydrogenase PreA subunit